MVRKVLCAIGAWMIAVSLAACGAKENPPASGTAETPKTEAAGSSGEPDDGSVESPGATGAGDETGADGQEGESPEKLPEPESTESPSGQEGDKGDIDELPGGGSTGDGGLSGGGTVTAKKAKKIAVRHAGVSENEVSAIRAKLEIEDGRELYEVTFYAKGNEYSYEIDTDTGEIIDSEVEIGTSGGGGSSSSQDGAGVISQKKAARIALKKVSGATENDLHMKLETEDGRKVYKGTILYNEIEYEFEIDAQSGAVLEWDAD